MSRRPRRAVHRPRAVLADACAPLASPAPLRSGRFSVVQSAVHLREKAKYAVKVVENKSLGDEENLEALETEIAILRKLEHPHIVSLKEVVVSSKDTYIVMELLSGVRAPPPEAAASRARACATRHGRLGRLAQAR